MKRAKKFDNQIVYAVYFLSMACLYFGGNIFYGNISFVDVCKFISFLVIDVLIPGMVIMGYFQKDICNKKAILPLAFGIGLIKVWGEFFLSSFCKFTWLGLAVICFVDVLCLTIFGLQLHNRREKNKENRIFYFVPTAFTTVLFLIEFLAVCMRGMLPVKRESAQYDIDVFYWIGNAISLKLGFPPTDFRCVGESYKYHYFSSLILAEISKITNIDVVELCLFFSPFIVVIILSFGMYALLSEEIKNEKIVAWLMLVALLTEGNYSYISHLYLFPFGFDYGIAFGILTVILLMELIKQRREALSLKIMFLAATFIFISTGCKGPVGIVILIGFGILSLWYLIKRRWKEGMVSGFTWLVAFGAAYFIFIYGNVSNGSAKLYIWGAKTIFYKLNGYGMLELLERITEAGLPEIVGLAISLLASLIVRNYVIIALFTIAGIAIIVRVLKKKEVLPLAALEMVGAWGIALTYNTLQSGSSQMYFMMSGYFAITLAGGIVIDSKLNSAKKGWRGLVIGLFALSLWGGYTAYTVIADKALEGIAAMKDEEYDTLFPYQTITKADYDTAIWMRDNLPSDAIVATDLSEENARIPNWIMGVFSEHLIWNSGEYAADKAEVERRKNLIHDIVSGNENICLENEGISYFLETKELEDNLKFEEAIYEDEFYRIWKISEDN